MVQTPHVNGDLKALEGEVDSLRRRAQSLASELERRVHRRVARARAAVDKLKHAVDVKALLSEHPRAAAGVGAGALVAIGMGIWWGVARSHRRQRFVPRLQRRAHALRQLLADPERHLAKNEPIARRVLAAVSVAAATVLARAIAQRLVIDGGPREPRRALPARSTLPVS